MLPRLLLVACALAVVIGVPFLLRPPTTSSGPTDDTLVIVTPHNEAIRYEFARAFAEHHRERTGRTVAIDWRVPGGTTEIARYLDSAYTAAFRHHWTRSLGRRWDHAAASSFDNPAVVLPPDPADDTEEQAARRAFLAHEGGIGVDLFFGGGAYDFNLQARAGRLVESGLRQRRPGWFTDAILPQQVSGEAFYDPEGRWLGAAVSSFGICYNTDSLARLQIAEIPASWDFLADPRLQGEVALADPTKSGSAAKAFEQILQEQMQRRLAVLQRENPEADPSVLEARAAAEGWRAGWQLLQKITANARFFTDAAPKVPLDVAMGDAAIGMCIDFYGRFQSEAVRRPDGSSRLQYFTPLGGSSLGVDPIGLLRGAPNRETAVAFMEFVLSEEGQKLLNFRVGTPGGPVRFALRRLPVRRDFYVPENEPFRSDPGVNPYVEASHFQYREAWTGPLFRVIGLLVRVMSMDVRREQADAWRALAHSGFPPGAMARFSDWSGLDYEEAMEQIRPVLRSPDRLAEVRLAKDLAARFRTQYREAAAMAREAARTDAPQP